MDTGSPPLDICTSGLTFVGTEGHRFAVLPRNICSLKIEVGLIQHKPPHSTSALNTYWSWPKLPTIMSKVSVQSVSDMIEE
jgi:hypothetical protein